MDSEVRSRLSIETCASALSLDAEGEFLGVTERMTRPHRFSPRHRSRLRDAAEAQKEDCNDDVYSQPDDGGGGVRLPL
jgi:hypothetical protein